MDPQFLEFWGNFLINAAQSQKLLEDFTKWLRLGRVNFKDLGDFFRQAYGLDRLNQDSPDYVKSWEKAEADFRESFKDYLQLLGVVPQAEYVALAKKYQELENKVAAQEEIIKHLRLLLQEKGLDFGELTLGFQELIRKQNDQFQKLMQGLGEFFPKNHETP